jgi:hypothetical protein
MHSAEQAAKQATPAAPAQLVQVERPPEIPAAAASRWPALSGFGAMSFTPEELRVQQQVLAVQMLMRVNSAPLRRS